MGCNSFSLILTGWPRETILLKPRSELLFASFICIGCFMLPVLISCGLYLALIKARKKIFINKIGAVNPANVEDLHSNPVMISEALLCVQQ